MVRWEQHRTGRCVDKQSDYARCGSPQSKLNEMIQPVLGTDRAQTFLEKLAPGTRKGYWCAWKQWKLFCEQRQQSEWIDVSGGPNWDETFIEFLLFHHKIMQRKAGTLKTKVAAVRYFHVIHGKGDFLIVGARVKALIKGVEKRERPNSKRPFNIELLEKMLAEVEMEERKNFEHDQLYVAAVIGFFFLLRVSEIGEIRGGDIRLEETSKGGRIVLLIRQSKTDQAGYGITRALMETGEKICPVREMRRWLEKLTTGERPMFGAGLRLRLEGKMKAVAAANGVNPQIIGTHSLRAGGATALYIRGISIILIQRFGRWKSSSFLRYLWYDIVALESLSKSLALPAGMMEQLRLARPASFTGGEQTFRAGGRSSWKPMSEKEVEADGWIDVIEQEIEEDKENRPNTKDRRKTCRGMGEEEGQGEKSVISQELELFSYETDVEAVETDVEALLGSNEERLDYLLGRSPMGGRTPEEDEGEKAGTKNLVLRTRSPDCWSGSESFEGSVSQITRVRSHKASRMGSRRGVGSRRERRQRRGKKKRKGRSV